MTAFGKYLSLDAFLVGYDADGRTREQRDVVEVDCTIAEVEPGDTDGVKHVLLHVELTGVIASDPDVDADVQGHLASHACVLVAIQYGGRHREIPEPIRGLSPGTDLRVRGRWIPAERARSMGGKKLSVLHFTHAPVGFVMVGGTVYR